MDTQYEKKYNELMACLRQMHDNNVRRMKMALRSLLIVPTIFLVLWIVSMFIIAAILIVIEYQDYTLRKMITRVEQSGSEQPKIAESAAGSDPRAEAIRESIRSRSPENDDKAGSFEYDNYEEAPTGKDE